MMRSHTEDVGTLEISGRTGDRIRYEEGKIAKPTNILRHRYRSMRHLFAIERFVREIEREYERTGKAKGIREWVDRDGYLKVWKYKLAKTYYGKLNEWLERYREGPRYSLRVEAFHDACKVLGILGKRRFWFGEPGDTDAQHDKPYTDWFNELIANIHERCQSRAFKERERLLEVGVRRNIEKLISFEEAIFSEEGRSRWLVIGLTLQIQRAYRGSITLDDIQQHRVNFFRARWSENHLMSCVKAHCWAIEEGDESGFHLHVILFCLPVTRDDESLANQIGDFWAATVTAGKGKFWNSNREDLKVGYERYGHGIGVGQVNRGDTKMRESLRANMFYLVKAAQHLQIRPEGNAHTFGKSAVPKKLKAGRPRNGNVVGAETESSDQTDMELLEDASKQSSFASLIEGAISHRCKSGVPLPFSIEESLLSA